MIIKHYHFSLKHALLTLFLSVSYTQPSLINEYHLMGADAYELPNISPANDLFVILASKANEGTFLLLCDLDKPNKPPNRLFNANIQKKKSRRGKRSESVKEETLMGWLNFDGVQYLYTVTNDIKSEPIISKKYSHAFDGSDLEVFEEFSTSRPNTPNVSRVLKNNDGLLISFLNGPYGYYHYVFDVEGAIIPAPSHFDLPGPIQSFSQWKNNSIIILEGQENIYHIWTSNKSENWAPTMIEIDLSEYTILGEANCLPTNNDIFSFTASTDNRMKMNQADLCIYSLSKDKIIKKITVHVPSEPFRGTEYSQWSKKHNRLYFLRQDDNEYIQSFYYDMKTGRVAECGIPDNRIKSFTISEQGDRLAVIEYPDGGHVIVYKLDE